MEAPFLMTPVEFEIAVRELLEIEGRTLKDFRVEHLERIPGPDGDYVIDVTARFEALGVDFLVIVECKRNTSGPVEREEVQVLNQKRISIGAQKAMFFATCKFRKGAIEFAKANRIALVQVSAGRVNYAVKSWSPEVKVEIVTPEAESLDAYLFEGNTPDEPSTRSQSDAVAVKAWTIGVLRQRLDYLRIVSARGYAVKESELESLRDEIAEETAALERIQQSEQ